MSSAESDVQTYLLSITVLPQQSGGNQRKLIRDINDKFNNSAGNVQVLHKFKVAGEARIVAVVDVPDIAALDYFVEAFWNLGSIDINSTPILHYEVFTRNIGTSEELVKLPEPKLSKDNLFWMQFDVEYHGKTMDEFLDLWKREAEFVLTPRARGESTLIPYKTLGQRTIHAFLSNPSVGQLDKMTFELPIMIEDGNNIQVRAKGIQFLEEYTK
ncbi:hypothetical protein BsWGS_10337 [Bradybaena similaris]